MMLQWKTKHCKTKSLLGQCHGRGGGHQPQHQHDNDNDDEEDVDDIAENLCVWQHRGGWPLASTGVGSGQSREIKYQRNTLPIFQPKYLYNLTRENAHGMLSMIYLFWTEEECDDKSNVSDGVMRLFGSGFLSGRRTRGVKRTAAAFQPEKPWKS